MELQDSGKIVQSIYFSLLGRAADPEGIGFWQERLESDGLQAVLSEIASSKEAQTYMQEASDSEYVADLYEQLFARAADTEGHDFWAGKLEAGELSRAELRGAVIQAAADTDTEALNAKLAVADYYSQNVQQRITVPSSLWSWRAFTVMNSYMLNCSAWILSTNPWTFLRLESPWKVTRSTKR